MFLRATQRFSWLRRLVPCARLMETSSKEIVVASPFKDIVTPEVGIIEFIWQRIGDWQEKTAIVCGVTGRGFTYAQLRDKCQKFGNSVRSSGLEPGNVVAVILENSPDYPVAVLGAIEAGLLVTTLNPDYTAGEIAEEIEYCNPRMIVTCLQRYDNVMRATKKAIEHGYQTPIIVVTDEGESKDIPQGALHMQRMIDTAESSTGLKTKLDPRSPVILLFSSGTVGIPKGVLLSHRNLVACLQIHWEPSISVLQPTSATDQYCIPAVLPFFHSYGLTQILMLSLSFGCKLVTLPKFEPKPFLELLVKYEASVLYVTPSIVLLLTSTTDLKVAHLNSVRFVVCGSAVLGEVDTVRFLKKAPSHVKFIQVYGLTETTAVVCAGRNNTFKVASVGPCVPNTKIKVIDVYTGYSLGPHKQGEICVRGPQVMIGYHDDEEETRHEIDETGWLHTGDIGYYDKDKDFYVRDRRVDLIMVGRHKVAPAELEELLRGHPAVLDVAVVGSPDVKTGEAIYAFVVPRPPFRPYRGLAKKLKGFVASQVVEYKQVAEVRFVKGIPKTTSGKILRRLLKKRIKQKQQSWFLSQSES